MKVLPNMTKVLLLRSSMCLRGARICTVAFQIRCLSCQVGDMALARHLDVDAKAIFHMFFV
jgi:hypothetical protein